MLLEERLATLCIVEALQSLLCGCGGGIEVDGGWQGSRCFIVLLQSFQLLCGRVGPGRCVASQLDSSRGKGGLQDSSLLSAAAKLSAWAHALMIVKWAIISGAYGFHMEALAMQLNEASGQTHQEM